MVPSANPKYSFVFASGIIQCKLLVLGTIWHLGCSLLSSYTVLATSVYYKH